MQLVNIMMEFSKFLKVLKGEDLITKKDVSFNSSSTSAQFVVAQSVNGNRAWKNENGTSLKVNKKK